MRLNPSQSVSTDWREVERSPEFGELVRMRRKFLAPALIAVVLFYGGFVLVAAVAPTALDETLVAPFTVAHAWALAQIPFAWAVATLYLRWCTRRVDPLTRLTARAALATRPEPVAAAEAEVVAS
jgi:uncharacterized membrane protein (DUF485 family)